MEDKTISELISELSLAENRRDYTACAQIQAKIAALRHAEKETAALAAAGADARSQDALSDAIDALYSLWVEGWAIYDGQFRASIAARKAALSDRHSRELAEFDSAPRNTHPPQPPMAADTGALAAQEAALVRRGRYEDAALVSKRLDDARKRDAAISEQQWRAGVASRRAVLCEAQTAQVRGLRQRIERLQEKWQGLHESELRRIAALRRNSANSARHSAILGHTGGLRQGGAAARAGQIQALVRRARDDPCRVVCNGQSPLELCGVTGNLENTANLRLSSRKPVSLHQTPEPPVTATAPTHRFKLTTPIIDESISHYGVSGDLSVNDLIRSPPCTTTWYDPESVTERPADYHLMSPLY